MKLIFICDKTSSTNYKCKWGEIEACQKMAELIQIELNSIFQCQFWSSLDGQRSFYGGKKMIYSIVTSELL